MIDLVFPAPELAKLRAALAHDALESAAILLAVPVKVRSGWRLLVREMHVAPDEAYEERTLVSVRLTPTFGLPIEKKARLEGWSLVYCHTHPREPGTPRFSSVDDRCEAQLGPYAASRSPNVPHGALVFGADQVAARELGKMLPMRVVEVGEQLVMAYDPSENVPIEQIHDRQVRAFGEDGQRRLHQLRIGVVGVGGTGSVVIQQLAHLGVDDYLLIDPDIVDASNLNRMIGALPSDVGTTSKVDVAKRVIQSPRHEARVDAVQADVNDDGIGQRLRSVDFIFCCTDSHASRHLVNQLAYQYYIPTIDVGIAIYRAPDGKVQISGRVNLLAPGLACLWCAEQLNPTMVRQELMNEEQQRADPYFLGGEGVVQPAVISLNSTLSSLAVTMFLATTVGIPAAGRFLVYDANRGRVTILAVTRNGQCNFCSTDSSAGGGDAYPLPVRRGG